MRDLILTLCGFAAGVLATIAAAAYPYWRDDPKRRHLW